MKIHIINTVKEILSFLFPFEELDDRPSVMIQDSWLSKIMRPTQIQDYLWHNEVKQVNSWMVKEITLRKAFEILQQCTAVILEGRFVEPHLYEIEDEYGNEFMSLQWSEEFEGSELDFVVSFNEGDNLKVPLEGCELTLVNSEGEEETLTLLKEWFPEVQDVEGTCLFG